jgi:hypothetical protein
MLARGETDTPKPTATGSVTLMLEINQESNAGRINSGSTAKSLKTQVFYSQMNSFQPRQSVAMVPFRLPDHKAWYPVLPSLGRVHLSLRNHAEFHSPRTT